METNKQISGIISLEGSEDAGLSYRGEVLYYFVFFAAMAVIHAVVLLF